MPQRCNTNCERLVPRPILARTSMNRSKAFGGFGGHSGAPLQLEDQSKGVAVAVRCSEEHRTRRVRAGCLPSLLGDRPAKSPEGLSPLKSARRRSCFWWKTANRILIGASLLLPPLPLVWFTEVLQSFFAFDSLHGVVAPIGWSVVCPVPSPCLGVTLLTRCHYCTPFRHNSGIGRGRDCA